MKHHSTLKFSWLLNMCSRGTLLAPLNSSIVFPLLFFIMYPRSFFSWWAYTLVHPHRWALHLLTMKNMCLATTFTRWEGYTRTYGYGISSSSLPLNDFRSWNRSPFDGFLSTAHIFLSSLLTMTSMIKKWLYNASYTIFGITKASILFELTSKFFGHSCSYGYSPLFSAASHFCQALEYSTIPMIPLLIPPMMKACLLEEPYLLTDDLFCQPISYVTVSLTLFLFSPLSDRSHQSTYDWLLCSSVSFVSSWRASSVAKYLTSRSAMPACASIL